MEIFEVPVQGFCGGVNQAIRLAKKIVSEHPGEKITVLGSLVHNSFVNSHLEAQGLHILEAKGKTRLELLDQIDDGLVIFTAHGVSNAVREKAREKGMVCIDASCPYVLSTQKLIAQKRKEGYTLFYIGIKAHPEAEAAMDCRLESDAPSNPSERPAFYLIETEEDIPEGVTGKIFVTNQTTMSVSGLKDLFDRIAQKYPQAEFGSEICNATRLRQQAVMNLKDQGYDLLVVIGDPKSNNTRKLAQTGLEAGIPHVLQIESASGVDGFDFARIQKVAVTSGASTPEFLKNETIERLHQIDQGLNK